MTKTYLKSHGAPSGLVLPESPKCKVVYAKDGVNYAMTPIQTPVSLDELHQELLYAGIGLSQVKWVESVG